MTEEPEPSRDLSGARLRLAEARVGRLATADSEGRPHVVPCCFALDPDGDVLYSAVDDKPKSTRRLRRLEDVALQPAVSLLVDLYAEDWSTLWWVQARGRGRLVEDRAERDRAIGLLRAKYPQYATHALDGPVLAVDLEAIRSWSAS